MIKGIRFRTATFLLILTIFCTHYVQSLISGSISMTPSAVSSTNVKYNFDLSGSTQFSQNGKLIVIFPKDYTFTSGQLISCMDNSNAMVFTCTLNHQANLIEIRFGSTFVNTSSMSLGIQGINNPTFAVETGVFEIRNYRWTGSAFEFLEPSQDTLKVTPTPGTLTQTKLDPTDKTVGVQTTLIITFVTQNPIPASGKIQLTFPKWNPYATQASLIESYISVPTSPGSISCTAISGITIQTCEFSVSSPTDLLELQIGTSAIPALTIVSFSIPNVKTPPSIAQITSGFVLSTLNSQGLLIDTATSITYQATLVGQLPPSNVKVTATNSKINTVTSLRIEISNSIPMPMNSNMRITIPPEFGVSQLTNVTGAGGRIRANLDFTLSPDKYQIEITRFNGAYLNSLSIMYIDLNLVRTPLSTKETSSFQVILLDRLDNFVEQVTSQVTFKATPGTITSVSVTPSNSLINQRSVSYSFKFTPEDTFSNQAIIKITFPDQISITNRVNGSIVLGSSLISASTAKLSVNSNKYAYITNAFPNGLTTSQPVELTINGITNAPTQSPTDQFIISIFYIEDSDVIDIGQGGSLRFLPSSSIDFNVDMLSRETGFLNTLKIVGDTGTFPVQKGSYLRVVIPPEFTIDSISLSAQTCIKVEGFSDEVQCSFSNKTTEGYSLIVRSGFESKSFSGGRFAFNISDIKNPFTTQDTSKFKYEVYDSAGQLQYYYALDYTLRMRPAPFQYAMVTSASPVNGISALYTFTLTLSVDTDVNSVIQIVIPDDITFDSSKPLSCSGLLNLRPFLKCENKNNKVFLVYIWTDKQSQQTIQNGTSISFTLGNFINPKSFEESGSFEVSTFITSNSNTNYYYINKEGSIITIQNTQRGNITNLKINQSGSLELGNQTKIDINFTSQSFIPINSNIVITLPQNIIVNSGQLSALLNGKSASLSYAALANTITIKTNSDNLRIFNISLISGLYNPSTGPYTYRNFIIDLQTSRGYSIDQTIGGQNISIVVNCTENCATCTSKLNTCASCQFNQSESKSYFLTLQKQCLPKCASGFYGDKTDFTCKKCEYPCLECDQGPQLCTKCFANHTEPYAYAPALTCYSTCPFGSYLDKQQGLCLKCESPCYTCTSKDKCLSCDKAPNSTNKAINFWKDQCYEKCPDGTVATASGQCVPCQAPCKTCFEYTDQCTACQNSNFLFKNVCVEKCPKQYLANIKTMTCEYVGEMAFPLPFSILTALFALGLIIARFMRNETQYLISVLAFTDIVIKTNWFFLFIYLAAGGYNTSMGIILYCIIANILINVFIWRIAFEKSGLMQDPWYKQYVAKYKWTSRFILWTSYIISFHFIRVTYSKLIGKKCFCGDFLYRLPLYRIFCQLTIFSAILVYLPAIAANAYNLNYVTESEQVFFFDIDSIILIVFKFILITFIMTVIEKVSKSGDSTAVMRGPNGELLSLAEIEQIKKDPTQALELQMVADLYSSNIFLNMFKKARPISDLTPHYTHGGILDLSEYKQLRLTMEQLQRNLRALQSEVENQERNRSNLSTQIRECKGENDYLLTEEERLRMLLQEKQKELEEYNMLTAEELREREALRREQLKHRIKISKLKKFIAETVLSKGKELMQEKLKSPIRKSPTRKGFSTEKDVKRTSPSPSKLDQSKKEESKAKPPLGSKYPSTFERTTFSQALRSGEQSPDNDQKVRSPQKRRESSLTPNSGAILLEAALPNPQKNSLAGHRRSITTGRGPLIENKSTVANTGRRIIEDLKNAWLNTNSQRDPGALSPHIRTPTNGSAPQKQPSSLAGPLNNIHEDTFGERIEDSMDFKSGVSPPKIGNLNSVNKKDLDLSRESDLFK